LRGPYAIDEEINNWLVDGSSLIENPKAIDTGAASPFPAPPPLPSEAMVDLTAGDGEDPRWRRSSTDCVSFLASRFACTKVVVPYSLATKPFGGEALVRRRHF